MAECPVAIQRGTLKRPDETIRYFFRRERNGKKPGFPRLKGRAFFNSISVISGVKVRDGTLDVPSFGALKIRRKGGNLYPGGRTVSPLLKRELGKWHAVVCHAAEIEKPADNRHILGLERNGGQVADSDGELHIMPKWHLAATRSTDVSSRSSASTTSRCLTLYYKMYYADLSGRQCSLSGTTTKTCRTSRSMA